MPSLAQHEELLSQLVSIKSYSGEERPKLEFIEKWLQERGGEVFWQGENLVLKINGENSQRAFVFNSHADTVEADVEMWATDPWTATKIEKKTHGLGTSDMEAGLAANMMLAEQLLSNGEVPPVDMWFTYVVREEVDGSGTAEFAQWFEEQGYTQQYTDMAAIFTEPTSLTEIEYGHRGNIFVAAVAEGTAGHSSRPKNQDRHSVLVMFEFAQALDKAMEVWRQDYLNGPFEAPTVGLFTSIQAGVKVASRHQEESSDQLLIVAASPNKFPGSCTATFDVRTVPGFHEVALAKIQELADQYGIKIYPAEAPAPAGYTDPSDPLVKVAVATILQETGRTAELTVSRGSADQGALTQIGFAAIILGPGFKDQAHQVNEYCNADEIPDAVKLYWSIAQAWNLTLNQS